MIGVFKIGPQSESACRRENPPSQPPVLMPSSDMFHGRDEPGITLYYRCNAAMPRSVHEQVRVERYATECA